MKTRILRVVAVMIIIATTVVMYRAVIFPANELAKYPWGSDTWGHLIKVIFLRQEIASGHLYPNIYPDWYGGIQLFRYYAPLPYYVMLAIWSFVGDLFLTTGWFALLCALFGGLSFLLYERRIGLFPATLGGVLFPLLPDDVRVAFAEGNLPRTLATSLLPITFYFVLKAMDRESDRKIYAIPVAIGVSLIVLSHAMMGAIFLVGLGLFCFMYWLLGGSHTAGFFRAVIGLSGGLLLSGWWLVPSLTGGITELNQAAVGEALANFPLTVTFNPFLRISNRELFYIGLGLGLGALLAAFSWRAIGPLGRAALVAGTITTLVTTSFLNPFFNSLPFHSLFWPIRFASFSSFALLLALLTCWRPSMRWHRLAMLTVLVVTVVDLSSSSALIFLRRPNRTMLTAAEKIESAPGWRVATADLSRLGSAPSYWLSFLGQREQVYGWGYQGARIATTVSSINFAMDRGYFDYAVDRLAMLGVDDVLFLNGVMRTNGFDLRLNDAGYRSTQLDNQVTLLHRDGAPRISRITYDVVSIGTGGQNLALLFPKIALGYSPYIDDYSMEYLSWFKTLLLSRFSWHDKAKAEALVKEFASRIGPVIVDLTGSPIDVFSREPKFLGVYGEAIQNDGAVTLTRDDQQLSLLPFQPENPGEFWQSHTPQGLDKNIVTFDYLGQQGVALGYKDFGRGRVWFTGLNLPFHALQTGDPVAVQLLEEVLGVRAGELPVSETIPLQDYRAGNDGYSYAYTTDRASPVIMPFASHEGATVSVDGKVVDATIIDNLIATYIPAGEHEVRISFARTRIYDIGTASTSIASIILLVYVSRSMGLGLKLVSKLTRSHARVPADTPVEAN